MELTNRNCSYFFSGALIGGFAGALAGILFAPKSGRELRSDLRHKGEETLGEAKRFYSETEAKAKHLVDDAVHRAEELKREADRQVCGAYEKAKRVLSREREVPAGEYAEEPRGDA